MASDSEILKWNHTTACRDQWPLAVSLFDTADPGNCDKELDLVDYNRDGFINFHEFIGIAYEFAGGGRKKGAQINCSSCVGMDYYNI